MITEQSKRLGMWMDWDNDYYTFCDTNIEYIWRFLKEVHRRGWLFMGHRSTQWCPRCGTSLSQHEQAGEGNYEELDHPSLYVRFPLSEREGESLVVWTTTPWTLPANVAAAVKPDADYGLANGDWWRLAEQGGDYDRSACTARSSSGSSTTGPFDELPAQEASAHRVIPWDEVALGEGTGIVHIAPGAGTEDFELGRVHGLPVIVPIDEGGPLLPGFGAVRGAVDRRGRGADHRGAARARAARRRRPDHPPLPDLLALPDAAALPRRRRLVHRRRRDPGAAAGRERDGRVDAAAIQEAHGRLAAQHGRLEHLAQALLRPPAALLSVRVRDAERGRLARRAGGARRARARAAAGAPPALDRRGADPLRVRATRRCGASPRSATPGSTQASSRSRRSAGRTPSRSTHGYATGAAQGLTGADLPDHAYWQEWFPADWISEMREQIRLWFYSQFFMAVTMVGRSPYQRVLTYEKLLDENGREMHRSWGNAIDANDAFDAMGADVMRWLFCEIPPAQNLKFGYGPAHEVKRRLLTLWNSVSFFVTYANIEEFTPTYDDLGAGRPMGTRSTHGSSSGRGSSSPRRPRPMSATGPRRSRARSSRSSTTFRTGTSAVRGAASGRPTTPRSGRSGLRSPSRCA